MSWLLLCVPLLLVEVPPLFDYPNHLARIHVLANIGRSPAFAANYVVHWGIVPDLATDAFMPFLVSIMPDHVAGRILVAGILLLDVLGVTSCAAALHSRRTWWSLAGALAAYNATFVLGFLNFNLATGLAMLGAAAWIVVRRRFHPALAACLGIATSVLLFFSHLMGLCFYLALIGSSELPSFIASLADRPRPLPRRAWTAVARCWPVLATCLPAPLLYAASGLRSAEGRTGWLGLRDKLIDCAAGFLTYDWRLDAIVMLAVAGVLAASRVRWARSGLLAFAAILILMVVLPQDMKGTSFVATRLAIMAAFLLFIVPNPMPPPALRTPALLLMILVLCIRVAAMAGVWSAYRVDVTNMRTLLRVVQPGDKVFQLDVGRQADPDYAARAPKRWRTVQGHTAGQHLGALTIIERDALWSDLFADPVQQPVSFKAELAASIAAALRAPSYHELAALRGAGREPSGANPYCGFQWVLLYDAWFDPDLANLAPEWLTLTGANPAGAMYRVQDGSCPQDLATAPDLL